jgi:protein SCO1
VIVGRVRCPFAILVALAVCAGVPPTGAGTPALADSDPHAQHRQDSGSTVRRSTGAYQVPDVTLVREDGRPMNMRAVLDEGGPVLVGFIFTTCTAICPVTSATFRRFQDELGPTEPLRIASISIDPEQDTPARLREYAHKFGAGPNWHHYTGSQAGSVAMQRAFDAYRGDKMDHTAVAFLRAAPGKPWVRIDGFASAEQLVAEYRAITAPDALALR